MNEILDNIRQSLSVAVAIKTVPMNGRIGELEEDIKKQETKQNKYHERYDSLINDLANGKQVIKSILKANQDYRDGETAIQICNEAIDLINSRIAKYAPIRRHIGMIDKTAVLVLGLKKSVLGLKISGSETIHQDKRVEAETGSLNNKRTVLINDMEALDLDTKDMIEALDELMLFLDNYNGNYQPVIKEVIHERL